MTGRGGSLAGLAALILVLAWAMPADAVASPAAQEPDPTAAPEPASDPQPAETSEPATPAPPKADAPPAGTAGQTGDSSLPGADAEVGATGESATTGAPVRVGRAVPAGVAQPCHIRWDRCEGKVRESFESMWKTHQARRESCDGALAEAEAACLARTTPERCARPARRAWKRCVKRADTDQRRKSRQIEEQWKGCARAYRDCVDREPKPQWW